MKTKTPKPQAAPFALNADTMKYQGEGAHLRVFLADERQGTVGELYSDGSRYLELRFLLTAAPDLLAALQGMIEWYDAGQPEHDMQIQNARAVIARAEGR